MSFEVKIAKKLQILQISAVVDGYDPRAGKVSCFRKLSGNTLWVPDNAQGFAHSNRGRYGIKDITKPGQGSIAQIETPDGTKIKIEQSSGNKRIDGLGEIIFDQE